MSDNTNGYNPTREQQQNMDNLSFDRKYLVNSVENLVEDEAGTKVERMVQPMKDSTAKDGSQKTQIVETIPTDSTNLNPSYVVSYNATHDIVRIVETVGSTSYTSNIVPTSGDTTIVYTKSISKWT